MLEVNFVIVRLTLSIETASLLGVVGIIATKRYLCRALIIVVTNSMPC